MKTPYEKLIRMMQKEGGAENPSSIQLATAEKDDELKIGELIIESDDMIKMSGIQIREGYVYAVYEMPDDCYLVLGRVVTS